HEKLPRNFRPQAIDSRFYREDRLTLLGVRMFREEDEILRIMERVVVALKSKILADPTLDSVSLKELSELIGQPENRTRTAVKLLSDHGSFFSGLSTGSGAEIDGIWFGG